MIMQSSFTTSRFVVALERAVDADISRQAV